MTPSAVITRSTVQPDPLPNETSSGGHYKVTAEGTVTNGTTARVDLGYPGLVVTSPRLGDLYVDSPPHELLTGQSVHWTASREFLFYDDPRYDRPYFTASVRGWSWADYADQGCPRA